MDSYESGSEDKFSVEGYSVDRIYSRATNKYGIGQSSRVNFPSAVLAAISKVVQSSGSGYNTTADFIRDSVVHRLKYRLDKGELDDPTVLRVVAAEEEHRLLMVWQSLVQQRQEQLSIAGQSSYREFVLNEIKQDIEAVPSRFEPVREALRRMLPN